MSNKKEYKANKVGCVIYSISAIVHDILLFFYLSYFLKQGYTISSHFVLFSITTVIWNISAIVWIYRYIKSKKR